MRLAVVNTKGGVGKTTTSVYLASAATSCGYTVTIADADPQGSATAWSDLAGHAGETHWSAESVNLHQLRKMREIDDEYDMVIIDCPPSNPEIINAAIRAADAVIIPSQPTMIDMDRVWSTLDSMGDIPAAVLLTAARLGTKLLEEAKEALSHAGVAYFDNVIPLREDIRASFGTVPTKLHGYDDVLTEILEAANA
ncbi:ParA family protein [Corynebacterium bovis]|nr:ParA family protein [Corynebacterium bovis]RRQ12004.1 chromosome partitioning protein ParA [Corynebacterium bovis]